MDDDTNSTLIDTCVHFAAQTPADLRLVVFGIVLPTIAGIGLLLNSASLLAIFFVSRLNGVTLLYLSSLTISNLVLMVLSIFWSLDRASVNCRPYSSIFYHANVELFLLNSTATFSLYVLSCMSLERYLSVVHPSYFRRVHRIKRARIALVISAVAALLIQGPMCLGLTAEDCCPALNVAVTTTPYWMAYLCVNQILCRFIPCAAVVFLNVQMIRKYHRVIEKRGQMTANSASQLNTPNNSNLNLSVRVKPPVPVGPNPDEKRMLCLLWIVVGLVVLCVFPAGLALLLTQFTVFTAVADALELLHYAVVSFVFCLCNNDIQRRLGLMITCNSLSICNK